MLEQVLIDVIMFFVGIDRVLKVMRTLAILLHVIQNSYSRIAHRQVDIARNRQLLERLPALIGPAICHYIAPIVGFAHRQRPAITKDAIPTNTASLALHCPENIS